MLTYLHGDALGSASLATSVTGTVVSSLRYYPYGGTRSGSLATDRRYTGQRWEGSVGFYDYGARSYDPALGRFLQADTIVPNPANPQSLNRYSYVLNNPLKYTDPTGHMEIYGGDTYPVSDYWYTYLNPALPECQASTEAVEKVASMGLDFTPGVGDAKGFIEVFTGRDLITGEDLGWYRYLGLVALSEFRYVDEAAALARFDGIGKRVIPGILDVFGDAKSISGKIPDEFIGRRVTTIGRKVNTDIAVELGERILVVPPGSVWSIKFNSEWIQESIKNGDVFHLVSPVTRETLESGRKFKVTVYARELDALQQAGYTRVGDWLIPPK